MTQRISREQCAPKEGGFETRPYKPRDLCLASQKQRVGQYALWRNYLFAGTEDAQRPSIYNKCGSHIDRLASMLFSPTDARFLVDFGRRVDKIWKARAQYISELLSEEFHGTGADLIFGEGVPWALTYGSAFMKLFWHPKKGLDPFLIMPSQLGVWREDVNAKGGLLGRKVEFVYYDDETNPATVPGIYTKLLDVDRVDFVVSGYGTNVIAPAMPIMMQRKLTFMSLFGLNVNEKFKYDRYFQIMPAGMGVSGELACT